MVTWLRHPVRCTWSHTEAGHSAADRQHRRAPAPPGPRLCLIYDAETGDFGIRVTAAGARGFVLSITGASRWTATPVHHRYFPDWSVACRPAKRPSGSSVRSTAVVILSVSKRTIRSCAHHGRSLPPASSRTTFPQAPHNAAGVSAADRGRHLARPRPGKGGGGRLMPTSIAGTTAQQARPDSRQSDAWRCCRRCFRWRFAGAGAPTTLAVASSATRSTSGSDT